MSKKTFNQELNEMQLRAVRHGNGPLLIIAGAGSGKTRTLTSRVIHLLQSGIAPENIIAITFTNKAAKEMRNRVIGQKSLVTSPFIGTFHSLGCRILKEEIKFTGRNKNFTIFDEDDSLSLVKKILAEMNLPKDRFNPLAIMAKISQIKNDLVSLDEIGSKDRYGQIIISVFKKYEDALLASNAFDFDDLLEKTVKIFQNNPEMLEKYQNRWQYILVDEFQDVNANQYIFIKLLAQKNKNLFVIGDDAQSIYAFRGSDFRNFLNFENDWPNSIIIKLEENYRSTQNIIRAASELIKCNKFQKAKELWTKNPRGNSIQICAYQNNEGEAEGIAVKIWELIRSGTPLKDIAILYRTNAQSRAIEQAFIRNQIPYEIFGGLKFYNRKEIKDVIAGLRYAFNPKDKISIDRIEQNFSKSKSFELINNLPQLANELSLVQLINFILEKTDYLRYLETHFKNPEERKENIKELVSFASTFTNSNEFMEQISLMSSLDGRPKLQENAIKLMTIHLAKGLEFGHVFIAGTNEGLLPHERSMAKYEELEEERRLMYVAMTRAKQNLFIGFYNLPSRFLGEIPPELIEFSSKGGSAFGGKKDWDDETIYID